MKLKFILSLAILFLLSSCSASIDETTTITISDIASNIAVDMNTSLNNLKIDESAATKKNGSINETYTTPQQKWDVLGQSFDLLYALQDGRLCGIELTMSIEGSEEKTFKALKDMYYSIENEFGLPETYPRLNTGTIKVYTVETIVKDNEKLESNSDSGGSCTDYWFFADEDKEVYIDMSCSYGGGRANYVVRFVDTEVKSGGRYVYKNLERKSQAQ